MAPKVNKPKKQPAKAATKQPAKGKKASPKKKTMEVLIVGMYGTGSENDGTNRDHYIGVTEKHDFVRPITSAKDTAWAPHTMKEGHRYELVVKNKKPGTAFNEDILVEEKVKMVGDGSEERDEVEEIFWKKSKAEPEEIFEDFENDVDFVNAEGLRALPSVGVMRSGENFARLVTYRGNYRLAFSVYLDEPMPDGDDEFTVADYPVLARSFDPHFGHAHYGDALFLLALMRPTDLDGVWARPRSYIVVSNILNLREEEESEEESEADSTEGEEEGDEWTTDEEDEIEGEEEEEENDE